MYKFFRGILTVIIIAAAYLFTGVLDSLMSLIPPQFGVFVFLLSGAIIVYFICLVIDAVGSGKKNENR